MTDRTEQSPQAPRPSHGARARDDRARDDRPGNDRARHEARARDDRPGPEHARGDRARGAGSPVSSAAAGRQNRRPVAPGRLRDEVWTPPETPKPPPSPRPLGEVRSWPRSFADRLTHPLPGLRQFVRVAREGGLRPGPEAMRQVQELPYAPRGLPRVAPDTVAVTWVGHASWVIRIGGLTVLADPVWSDRILGTPARLTPPGVDWAALPTVDAVVISHNHYDHLDAPTLRRLPRSTPLLVPAGLGRWCRRRRFTQVTELDWWEAVELPTPDGGGVRFDFVPSHHWSKRTLGDTCRTLWGGWVLTDPDGQRVYFAGDTGYGHWFAEIGRRFPGIDLALLPIGAYQPGWLLRGVHTDPEEAVLACGDLGARRMAPMHWATFVLSSEPPLEPLGRVRAAWREADRPADDLWDLPVGGSRVLDP